MNYSILLSILGSPYFGKLPQSAGDSKARWRKLHPNEGEPCMSSAVLPPISKPSALEFAARRVHYNLVTSCA